jgi:hypothetical protein
MIGLRDGKDAAADGVLADLAFHPWDKAEVRFGPDAVVGVATWTKENADAVV